MKRFFILVFLSIFVIPCCTPGAEDGGPSNGVCQDYDQDNICDDDEGKGEDLDTDGDGIPDYMDKDSDDDGIPDATEVGDDDPSTSPRDSDNDGIPDYLDEDSDNNGIPDSSEGIGDLDGDGIPNFADLDNDGDGILDKEEIGGDPYNPRNTDENYPNSDTIPDYNDKDSDNDGIADLYEKDKDADGDGVPNYLDLDSDGDGIPDDRERGNDGSLSSGPVDSDGDGYADPYDIDSDNDGLLDNLEDTNQNGVLDPGESDPKQEDTDHDGISDMIEHAAGTDPSNPDDNPRARGDFVFIEPYQKPQDPTEDILNFSTSFKALDIMFAEDISGSMSEEITSVKNMLSSTLSDLICGPGEDPDVTHCIPDVETGISVFGGSYNGQDCDGSYCLIKPIDSNNSQTQSMLPTDGNGGSEYGVGAVWDTLQDSCQSDPRRIGKGCYRPYALKVAILVTDETLRQGGYYSTTYFDPIYNNGVKIVLLYTGSDSVLQNDGVNMVTSNGEHLIPELAPQAMSSIPECQQLGGSVFYQNRAILDGDGSSAGPAMECAVKAVSAYMPQDVEAIVKDGTENIDANGNPVNAQEAFIDHIEVFMAGDATCPDGYNTTDINSDGIDDKFVGIMPGDAVCWKIFSKQNDTVEPTSEPQMFTAIVEVYGAGGALLDTREVYFLVPPVIEGPGGPE